MRRGAPNRRDDEAGTITLWMLGLCVVLLFLGGLSIDLWRAFTERRELAGVVDSAAIAGASAIDEDHFRSTGEVVLDPRLATATACAYLADLTRPVECDGIAAAPQVIEVRATRQVRFTFLKVLLPDQAPLTIDVSARVEPRPRA